MIRKWSSILLCLLLSALLFTGILPGKAEAAQKNAFVLVVESGGKLVVGPEYVSYQKGQTIAEALEGSGHRFTGLERGHVYAVNGVAGNYTRSDQNGDYSLSTLASEVTHYRFSENTNSQPSEGLQKLMTALADYNLESADVQKASEAAFGDAQKWFVGATSANASAMADKLNSAVEAYKSKLNGSKYAVTFSDGTNPYSLKNYPGVSITATNAYGRVWTDSDGDGAISLPEETYTFCIRQDGLQISGTVKVTGAKTIKAKLPVTNYLKTDTLRLSGSDGPDSTDETVSQFRNGEFQIGTWNGRSVTVPVSDTFAGSVYINAQYTGLSKVPKLTAIYTPVGETEETEFPLVFNSLVSGPSRVLARGAEGNTVVYRLSVDQSDGYTYSQDYVVTFSRVPSLKNLSVQNDKGVDQAASIVFDPDITEYDYKVLNTVSAVTVKAEGLGTDYRVTVNGKSATEGARVVMNTDSAGAPANTDITIQVSAGEYARTYVLHVLPGQGQEVTLRTNDSKTYVEVVNANGVTMPCEVKRETGNYHRYIYTLVPGESYYYVATKNTHYHVRDEIVLNEEANRIIQVSVPTEDWLTDLALGSSEVKSAKGSIALDQTFAANVHSYTVALEDTQAAVYLWTNGLSNLTYTASYSQIANSALTHGVEKSISLTPGNSKGVRLANLLMQQNPYGNEVVIRLSRETEEGITEYQDYVLNITRSLTLSNLEASYGGSEVSLIRPDGNAGYKTAVRNYTVTVPMAADYLELALVSYTPNYNTCYGEDTTGYRVKVNGTDVTENAAARIDLNGTIETETAKIQVTNVKTPGLQTTYTLQIQKSTPVNATFRFTPTDAVLNLHETISQNRIWPDNAGAYQLCEDFNYSYSLTSIGYVGQQGTIRVTRNAEKALVLYIDDRAYPVEEAEDEGVVDTEWTMVKAAANTTLKTSMPAEWPDFRGNSNNNAVTSAPVPYVAESGTLYWAEKLGEGTDTGAVGNPILVDGKIVTYAGSNLYKVDPVSGEILDNAPMVGTSSFAITPPTYHKGMIFVALSGGRVQAFNAKTLESLWVYEDPLGGQPNCPITVSDGRLYTGFWNQETMKANFVCLTVTDENPYQTHESKPASWYVTHKGGFYWAGACVRNGYVLVGTDDGDFDYIEQTSNLLLLDAKTGKQLDSWKGLDGDIRSTVMYDTATDAYYFTSKGGTFYSVRVANGSIADRWSIALQNGTDGVPMSTSTPVVHNGRAYIGVSGVGQFAQYGGHNITVIDLGGKRIAYRVATHGYPQTSGLLTTAYKAETGSVYVYFFDNMTPGKLRVLRDKPGQTAPSYVTAEGEHTTAYALFTPVGDQAEYAICSPVVDEYGTVYFKNDSGHLMAFGSTVKSLTVTSMPKKLEYSVGDSFDPTGMRVTATYTNGKTRDVTDYVTWMEEPLTAADSSFSVIFPYVMYHNQENGGAMDAGVATLTPQVQIELTILGGILGDLNGDNTITEDDAKIILEREAQATQKNLPLSVADVSGDGKVDSNDAVLILQYAQGKLRQFPAQKDAEAVTEEITQ